MYADSYNANIKLIPCMHSGTQTYAVTHLCCLHVSTNAQHEAKMNAKRSDVGSRLQWTFVNIGCVRHGADMSSNTQGDWWQSVSSLAGGPDNCHLSSEFSDNRRMDTWSCWRCSKERAQAFGPFLLHPSSNCTGAKYFAAMRKSEQKSLQSQQMQSQLTKQFGDPRMTSAAKTLFALYSSNLACKSCSKDPPLQ